MKKTHIRLLAVIMIAVMLFAASAISGSAASSTVNIYNNGVLYKSFSYTAGDNLPAIEFPTAPANKYFAGFSTDSAGNNILTETVLPAGTTALYCVFRDYQDNITDNYSNNTSKVLLPINTAPIRTGVGGFVPTVDRAGWSFKKNNSGLNNIVFNPSGNWGEWGCYVMTDSNGEAVRLRPHAKYRMTVQYKTSAVGENGITLKAGFGMEPRAIAESRTDILNTCAPVVISSQVANYTSLVYEFDTGALTDVVPVAGLNVRLGPTGTGVNKLYVKSIKLECLKKNYGEATLNFGTGYADRKLTVSTLDYTFWSDESTAFPEGYKLGEVLDSWYTDSALTNKVTAVSDGGTYYAKFLPFGDVNGDGNLNSADIIRLKKYIAGQSVEISKAAEVTGNTSVNNGDLLRLVKKAASFKVSLGTTYSVAIYFDNAIGSASDSIVDTLNAHGFHASFVVKGADVTSSKEASFDKIDRARDEFINGTYNGTALSNYTTVDLMAEQYTRLETALDNAFGYTMPFGVAPQENWNYSTFVASEKAELPFIASTAAIGDDAYNANINTVVNNVVNAAYDGAIIRLTGSSVTVNNLDRIIKALEDKNFQIVTVSKLFQGCGISSSKIPVGGKLTEATTEKAQLTMGDRKLVWSDEFDSADDGMFDTKKWNYFKAGSDPVDFIRTNDAEHFKTENGTLTIKTTKDVAASQAAGDDIYDVPDDISTAGTMLFKYGYLEMCANVPFQNGSWASFWLQSQTEFSKTKIMSEIDIFEIFARTRETATTIHKWDTTDTSKHTSIGAFFNKINNYSNLKNEYHVYGFEWDDHYLKFYFDGNLFKTVDISEEADFSTDVISGVECFNDYHYIILGNGLFTEKSSFKGGPIITDDLLPMCYNIEWMRLYQKDGESIITF